MIISSYLLKKKAVHYLKKLTFVCLCLLSLWQPLLSREILASAINKFAFKLIDELDHSTNNIFFSPFGLYYTLAMIAHDAGEPDIKKNFFYESNKVEFYNALKNYTNFINSFVLTDGKFQIKSALFMTKNLEEKYQSGNIQTFFSSNLPTSINQWFFTLSGGEVSHFEKGTFTHQNNILYNFFYFKLPWATHFKKVKMPFVNFDQTINMVKTLYSEDSFLYGVSDNLKIIGVEYEDSPFVLLIFLPQQQDDPLEYLYMIRDTGIRDILDQLEYARIEIMLPEMYFDYEKDFTFLLSRYFGKKVTSSTNKNLNPTFLQKIYYEINNRSGYNILQTQKEQTQRKQFIPSFNCLTSYKPKPQATIYLDHPFLFFLVEKNTGLILFVGVIRFI